MKSALDAILASLGAGGPASVPAAFVGELGHRVVAWATA